MHNEKRKERSRRMSRKVGKRTRREEDEEEPDKRQDKKTYVMGSMKKSIRTGQANRQHEEHEDRGLAA